MAVSMPRFSMLRVLNDSVLSPQMSPQQLSVTNFCIGRLKSSALAHDFSTWAAPSTSLRFSKPFSKRSLLSILRSSLLLQPVQLLCALRLPDAMIVRQSKRAKFFGRIGHTYRLSAVTDQRLRFQILAQTRFAPLAPVARALVAAKRRMKIGRR